MIKDDHFESITMEILNNEEVNTDPVIKVDDLDDLDDENGCGMQMEEKSAKVNIKKIPNKKICYKCKKNKSNYLNRTEYICRECFLKNLHHKFRSNLRAHCKIRHEDYVLVCISGGNNSMAMLHWFYTTFNDNSSNRKLFFKLKVIYVDDSLLMLVNNLKKMDEVIAERERRREFITGLCLRYGFEVEVLNLEEVLNVNQVNKEEMLNSSNGLNQENKLEKYLSLYNLISNIGSFQEDFTKITTRNLIFSYAINHGFTKVVFGNSAQALVSNIFSSIVKGRGFSVREDIGYIDDHFLEGRITILRPMKDFLAKEVLLFNYIHNVDIIYPTLFENSQIKENRSHTPYNGNTSLLIDRFFDRLQERMSSTVTTVLGTADKLKLKSNSNKTLRVCTFCLSYVDDVHNELEIGSIDSINSSKIFSCNNLCFGCKRMFQSAENEEIMSLIPSFNF